MQTIQGPNPPSLLATRAAALPAPLVPGALDAGFYAALKVSLNKESTPTAVELRVLTVRIPKIDPDDFVAKLAQLAADKPDEGASSPDEGDK